MPNINAECSIIDTSEDMSQVKVFVTDGRMSFNVPRFRERQGTISLKLLLGGGGGGSGIFFSL